MTHHRHHEMIDQHAPAAQDHKRDHKARHLLAAVGATTVLCAVPVAASAELPTWLDEPGIYLGGGIGYNRVEGEDFPNDDDDFEDSHVSYKGLAGVRINRAFSIEGQYVDFGTAEDGDSRVEADGWTAGAVLTLPMWEYVNPYAKAGALFWDADGRTEGNLGDTVRANDDGSDFVYGVGVRFHLTDMLELRTEYERFELEDIDVDMGSAVLSFNF